MSATVVTNIEGLDAAKTSALRRECFKQDVKLVMVKNKFFIKALERKGIDVAPIATAFKGTSAIMFCNTGNVPAKLIKTLNKKEQIVAQASGIDQHQSTHAPSFA